MSNVQDTGTGVPHPVDTTETSGADDASDVLPPRSDHMWLIGMMGSGKRTIGAALAAAVGAPFVDTDDVVVASQTEYDSIAALWESEGENAFRDVEQAAVTATAERPGPVVIATGGGVVLRDSNVAAMRASGRIVWLSAPPDVLAGRIRDDGTRPLLAIESAAERLAAVLEERASRYESAADVIIDTGTTTIGEVVTRLEAQWRSM